VGRSVIEGRQSSPSVDGTGPSLRPGFVDEAGREIHLRPYDPSDRDALVGMYESFDPSQRAQGIPPVRTDGIESWLDSVLDGPSVVAWHGDRAVGHVMFVPDGDGGHELAIFVHQTYQGTGIGSRLIDAGLEHAAERGVTYVWLLVAWGNTRARGLYEKTGFTVDDPTGSDLRLSKRL
jgi:ribosomal protein S18 acetylase RimI-like enzyme